MPRVENAVLQPKKLSNGTSALYFSRSLPYSDPNNARELIDNKLFYLSAQRFDVFACFSGHMSRKPAILQESVNRFASRFRERNKVVIKELGAGSGDSMAIVLGDVKKRYSPLYKKLSAYASDGYEPVCEAMKRSKQLRQFISENKLDILREDLLEDLHGQKLADYVRVSYSLSDLPEDIVKKENGRFYAADVRGYITGKEGFRTQDNENIPVKYIAGLLSEGKLQEIIDLGLDIRDIKPRVGFDVKYAPMDFAVMTDGGLVRNILEQITAGMGDTKLRTGLNAAKAVEKILNNHLRPDVGSYIEAFDVWTSEIMPHAHIPYTALDLTSAYSVNLPFIKAYFEAKKTPIDVGFEDWKRYINLTEPYIDLSHFSRWLKGSGAEIDSFFGRHIPARSVSMVVDFLKRTQHVADMVLYSEKQAHPFILVLNNAGFTEKEKEMLFISGKFPETVNTKTKGYFGLYQVVTIKNI